MTDRYENSRWRLLMGKGVLVGIVGLAVFSCKRIPDEAYDVSPPVAADRKTRHPQKAEAHEGDSKMEHNAEGGHGHHVRHSPEEWAQRLDGPEREAWQKPRALMRIMGIRPGETVAEIGAGTGYFLRHLSTAVGDEGRVLARDVEADLVEHMRRRAEKEHLKNISVAQCPFDDTALARESVDRILFVNTWHHISNRVAYSKKLALALKPGGAIYVVDFNKNSSVGPPPEAKLNPDQVIADLDKAGFETELLEEDLPEQYIVRAFRP